jgi:hypothetical protein
MLIGVLIALRHAWRWAAVHPAVLPLATAGDWHGFPLLVRAPPPLDAIRRSELHGGAR